LSGRALDILQYVEYHAFVKLSFLSKKKGMGPLSGELELPVMEILWDKGPLKGRDLYIEVRKQKGIAYTTALTVLDRLSRKGLVKKARDSGTILFSSGVSQEQYESEVAGSLIDQAFEVSPDLAVSAFADICSRMPDEEFARLGKLIGERKRERRK
jgi:predicted transcriptional regulator